MKQSSPLNRRELITAGCRTIGALSLAGGAAALLDGCAHVPASAVVAGQKLMRVTYQVAGQIQPVGSAIPYYYFVVINLTNTPGDPGGPVPIGAPPYNNAIAAPPSTDPTSQGFVGFIQYDSNSGAYGVYTCPLSGVGAAATFLPSIDVTSPTGFSYQGIPNTYVLPAPGSNTIDVTIDLNRLKADPSQTLASYVQVNIITYNSLPISNNSQSRDYDAIGDGRSVPYGVQTLTTAQSGQSISSSQIPEPTGDVLNSSGQVVTSATLSDVANIDLSSWLIQLL